MANWLCRFVQMGHAKQLENPVLIGGGSWWYEVHSVEILSAKTVTTTTETIESLQTERITPEGMMGGGGGGGRGPPHAVTA